MTEMDIQKLYSLFKECSRVTTDSRTVEGGELFFALKGENFDGNEYALKALEQGARYAVVDGGTPVASSGDPRLFVVPETLSALQALARCHRENTFVDGRRLTVIGLTGTNGKTTTKELVTRVLSAKYNVTATKGNLNNDIGVPLSILEIGADTQLAVIEMGASHPEDIAVLVEVCEPDYGLVTNVGKAHLLGFGSFEGVKMAKGRLYDYIASHGGNIFLNVDDPDLTAMAEGRGLLSTAIPYGIRFSGSEVLPSSAGHPFLRLKLSDGRVLETHLAGAYNATNVLAAIAVGQHFGVTLEEAAEAVSSYVPTNNRSQMEDTGRNILIKDAYNANPTSMAAALDNLALVEAPRKVALLGDMRELGEDSVAEHVKVVGNVSSMGLDLVCLVGEEFGKALSKEDVTGVKWFQTSDDLASWLADNHLEGATVLVKGSRGIRMEKVMPAL